VRKHAEHWLARDYIPGLAAFELTRRSATEIVAEMDAHTVVPLPLPADFSDGVWPAHWQHPEAYLDPDVRRSASALNQIDPGAVDRGIDRLRADLASGRWHDKHGHLLEQDEFDAGFCLIVSGRLPTGTVISPATTCCPRPALTCCATSAATTRPQTPAIRHWQWPAPASSSVTSPAASPKSSVTEPGSKGPTGRVRAFRRVAPS
jgi:hypothetical protein